jgi:copper chaperone CopZ
LLVKNSLVIAACAALIATPAAALAQAHDHSVAGHAHHGATKPVAAQGKAAAAGSGAVVKVNGLICDFCVQALNKSFRKQAAVRDIAVDLDAKEIRLAFKPGASLDDATIGRLVKDAGYNLVSIMRPTA